jgi:hypothetical protein
MAGQLTIDTLKASSGVLATQNGMTGIAKAWVQFAGSTGTIAGSFNVSSVTRSSTGTFTINFTTAMANANYSVVGSVGGGANNGGNMLCNYQGVPTTSACYVSSFSLSPAVTDYLYSSVAIFGS